MVFVDRISVTTPERVAVEHEIAGVGSRAVAQLLDTLIMAAMYGVLIGVVVNGLQFLPRWAVLTFVIVTSVATPFVYYILFEWREGCTPGKRVLRIRVVTEAGAPIGLRESAVRNVLRVIDMLPLLYVLGGTVAMCSARSQRLGDMAAGTLAVRLPKGYKEERVIPGRAPTSFVDMVAGQAPAIAAPAAIATVTTEYLARRAQLGPHVRADLAARLAERLETRVPRPLGYTDEQYIEYAETMLKR